MKTDSNGAPVFADYGEYLEWHDSSEHAAYAESLTPETALVRAPIIQDLEPDDETLGPCGCTDYHMADCPTRDHDPYDQTYDPYEDDMAWAGGL